MDVAALDCYKKIRLRNLSETEGYRELVEGYSRFLLQAGELNLLARGLKSERDELKLLVEQHKDSAAKGAEAQALHEKLDALQLELGQSYKSNAEVSQHLVVTTKGLQQARNEIDEKDKRITALEELLDAASARAKHAEEQLHVREEALALAVAEGEARLAEAAAAREKLEKVEAENKALIERWMEQKMKDAERLNEANAMYEQMVELNKSALLSETARRQVDGVVRFSEAGAEEFVAAGLPSNARHTVRAHEGGCACLAFDHGSGILFSGGNDRLIKAWETAGATAINTLHGSVGSILDVAVSQDNRSCLSGGSDNKGILWDVDSGRLRHIFTGHTEKVVAVDFSRAATSRAVTAAHDRTIKVWDLVTGYCVNTIVCFSNCNALCVTSDGVTIVSGHVDGNLRFWDLRTGANANEVAAHAQGITSVSLSRSGTAVLTNARDNLLNLFDVRTFEARSTFRAPNYRVATNWSRACLSPDEKYVAAGSADGNVLVWSVASKSLERTLHSHSSAVLSCVWSDVGRPLASADKTGAVVVWE